MSGRFEGTAYLRGNELEVEIPHAWIAVTRDNDKEWDDLHLAVEISRHPLSDTAWFSLKSIPVVLRPTVDSAGPQLTTWETQDTLRLIVPWQQWLGPRWLIFVLDYRTLSHAGARGACSGRLGTDTLRFSSRGRY